MKLTVDGIKNRAPWEEAGIALPGYDVEKVSEKAKKEPVWVHFGIGNIFRIFIAGIADGLLEEGVMDRGITCVETFDYDVVDKIYEPYDNLGLSVILHGDGTREYRWFLLPLRKKDMLCTERTEHGSLMWKPIFRTDRTGRLEQWRC